MMKFKISEKTSKGKTITISATTLKTENKVPPAKYESGFKKVNSKSAKKMRVNPA
jgi:hypothetical protein